LRARFSPITARPITPKLCKVINRGCEVLPFFLG
jgi:hypothetical protein